ncbi:MAG: ATP-binding protein [Oscillospiraceae bacterium]|nr:ATP-binding protein [Oscillospiraceae bacterium]
MEKQTPNNTDNAQLLHIYSDIFLEFCPNIIILLDNNGKFVLYTKVLLNETGIKDSDYIQGRYFKDVFANIMNEEACAKLVESIDKVGNTKEPAILNEYIDFGNRDFPRYYTIELTPVQGFTDGDVKITSGILSVFHDLTDFMAEKERAETANRAKADFLATISHEIRTPMNAIMGMTELLGRAALDDKQKEYVKNIKKSSNSLMSIIDDILDFSKIEAGEMDIINSYYNLRELFENLYAMFMPMFRTKNLDFYYSVSKAMPDIIYGDDKRLKQILINILSNGLKYTPEGHVEFYAWMDEENMLHVGIHDTGIGIRPKDVKKLFLPFEQLDLRKKETIVGTGLGLAISRRLCELMNGQLSVESTYGAGTTFSIEIPFMSDLHDKSPDNNNKFDPEGLAEFSAAEAKVLVVDDIDINLSVAEAMLQIFDISPDLALKGIEALEMASNKQYDIIFMDHMMPEMDGFETMQSIRMLGPQYADIPIIVITANVINDAKQMFLENGFDGFLPKPLEIDELNLCLRKFLPNNLIKI